MQTLISKNSKYWAICTRAQLGQEVPHIRRRPTSPEMGQCWVLSRCRAVMLCFAPSRCEYALQHDSTQHCRCYMPCAKTIGGALPMMQGRDVETWYTISLYCPPASQRVTFEESQTKWPNAEAVLRHTHQCHLYLGIDGKSVPLLPAATCRHNGR